MPAVAITELPSKPYKGFPLYAHRSGYWAKKVRHKTVYFGRWEDDREGKRALKQWDAERADRLAGRQPRQQQPALAGDCTMKDLCNRFYNKKKRLLDNGEISPRTFADYKATTDRLIAEFGLLTKVDDLTADDFDRLRDKISDTRGLVALGNEVQRVKTVFRFGLKRGLYSEPVPDEDFKKPSRKAVELERVERMFSAHEIRSMYYGAGVQLRAMILLGINCGYGNSDIGNLPLSALDLHAGWVRFPRPKTAVKRRCPLWPETVDALQAALKERPVPRGETDTDLVFVTKSGGSWAKDTSDNPVTKETAKLLKRLKMHRPGLSFYGLRHTFQTEAENVSVDLGAVEHIMGHVDTSMSQRYRERLNDERLMAVVNHVHAWLWPRPTVG